MAVVPLSRLRVLCVPLWPLRSYSAVPTAPFLQRVGDGGVVAAQGADVVGQGVAADAFVMAAVKGRRQAEMRGAGLLPEPRLLGPFRLVTGTHRDPHLDTDLGRIAAGLLGQPA